MEQWEKDFNRMFVTPKGNLTEITPQNIRLFIKRLLKAERSRDKLKELIDYVKESRSNTDILVNYIYNTNNICDSLNPSNELCDNLGLKLHTKEGVILCILERYYNTMNSEQSVLHSKND